MLLWALSFTATVVALSAQARAAGIAVGVMAACWVAGIAVWVTLVRPFRCPRCDRRFYARHDNLPWSDACAHCAIVIGTPKITHGGNPK